MNAPTSSAPGSLAGNPTGIIDRVESVTVVQAAGSFQRLPDAPPSLLAQFAPVMAVGQMANETHAQVIVQFGMRLVPTPDPKSSTATATVDAAFVVVYELTPGPAPSAQDLDAFSRLNGAFNAYPYWRHFLEESLFRMAMPRITLPPFIPGKHAAHSPASIEALGPLARGNEAAPD